MPTPLSLISLNCQGHRHLNLILPFLKYLNPDVICLQEVYAVDIPTFEKELNKKATFVALCTSEQPMPSIDMETYGEFGIAILTSLPVKNSQKYFYAGDPQVIPPIKEPNDLRRALLMHTVNFENTDYTIMTTHFTWSPGGQTIDVQRRDLQQMLQGLQQLPEFVLCGDFNAPRGGDIYQQLAQKYKDNIPPEITSTLDEERHRAGKLDLVVDYLGNCHE